MGKVLYNIDEIARDNTLFAIRGSLDGETDNEFTEREQFIGLKIKDEEFYLSIATVSEILMLKPITYVPQSGQFIEGVINLRGNILAAINLRKMMGVNQGRASAATRIIIAHHGNLQVGLLVDAITYVVALLPSEIDVQSLPGKSIGSEIISRIAKHGESVIGILDVSKIIHTAADKRVVLEEFQEAS